MSAHLRERIDRRQMGRDLVGLLFRYLAWRATHGRILPDFCDLPQKLMDKASEAQFEILYERIEEVAARHDSIDLKLCPIRGVKFPNDYEAEAARRAKLYAKQWSQKMARIGPSLIAD